MFFGKPIKTLSARELKIGLDAGEIALFDVREVNEYNNARINGAKLVPLSQFNTNEIKADTGKIIVLYCQGGVRSGQAAKKCIDAGIDVCHLGGGIMSWHSQGYEIVAGK